jgi:hypothetical protein
MPTYACEMGLSAALVVALVSNASQWSHNSMWQCSVNSTRFIGIDFMLHFYDVPCYYNQDSCQKICAN